MNPKASSLAIFITFVLLLLSSVARADAPIGFVGRWSKAVTCAENDCINFPISNTQTLAVGVLSGSSVLLMVWIHDCTVNTNMNITVSDNGGNTYSIRNNYSRANCGTQDVFLKVYRVLSASAATILSVTQTNIPGSANYAAIVFTLTAYSNVGSFGAELSGLQTSSFPYVDMTRTLAGSWLASMFYEESANQLPSGMNVGNDRGGAGGVGGFGSRVMAFDSSTIGGVSGGGHDCDTKICIEPNFADSHTFYRFATELKPVVTPPPPPSCGPVCIGFSAAWLFGYATVVILALYGSWWIRKKRGSGGLG